jgi:cytochrome c oxidase subunit 2
MKRKLLLLTCLGAVVLAMSISVPSRAQSEPRMIELTAHRFTYDPNEITLKLGQPVVLVVKSDDVAHGLRIRELGVDFKIPAHGTAKAQFTPTQTGNFIGHCSVFCGPGHGTMALTVHVVE